MSYTLPELQDEILAALAFAEDAPTDEQTDSAQQLAYTYAICSLILTEQVHAIPTAS